MRSSLLIIAALGLHGSHVTARSKQDCERVPRLIYENESQIHCYRDWPRHCRIVAVRVPVATSNGLRNRITSENPGEFSRSSTNCPTQMRILAHPRASSNMSQMESPWDFSRLKRCGSRRRTACD